MDITLDTLCSGTKAEILRVGASGEIRRRLLDMGVVKGTHIKVVRVAPLGDPIEIHIKGFNLSLRKEEAKTILVKVLGTVGDGKPMGGFFKRRRKGSEIE